MDKEFKNKNIWIGGAVLIVALSFFFGLKSNGDSDMAVVAPNQTNKAFSQEGLDQLTDLTDRSNPSTYDYSEAVNHIGEYARIAGTVVEVYTAKSGVTFLDYCKNYKTCPFTAVIFASDATKFPNLKQYTGPLTITGEIKSYKGKAEIILKTPSQITVGN